jgi:excinuclease ABC subunit C
MKKCEDILNKVRNLPQVPGVYKFIDAAGKIIYVGKAKNLKKRVSSYFAKNLSTYKTQMMVRKIHDIDFIVVESETDALLLENQLIKNLQPKYNFMLKDDKTYPLLCIKKEPFPRLIYTREKVEDGSEYFGPFSSVYTVKTLLSLIRQLYPLRTCNYNLTQENIKAGKFKVCLEYHIGNCKAPCEAKIDETEYNSYIEDVRKIIRGDLHLVQNFLSEQMKKFAAELKFEEAATLKQKYHIIENYRSKSAVVSSNISNLEVFGYAKDIDNFYINWFLVKNGAIISSHSMEIRKKLDEADEEILLYAIIEMRKFSESQIKTVLLPIIINEKIEGLKFEVPKRGDKFTLLELAQRNAKFFMLERHKQIANKSPQNSIQRKLRTLQNDLALKDIPDYIECFDNSNIQGTNSVAACVVFRDAKPAKSEYRHYNIKTVEGPDDFASMYEVVYRRYRRLLDENQSLPKLIVIDGGKGQLSYACKALEDLKISDKVAVIGIAKKLEEIFFPNDPVPLYLDKNSESLKIIQQIRDEAHRFGISFHRDKRSKNFITSELDAIKGIGEKTKTILLRNYKTIQYIKNANFDELSKLVGKSKANLIIEYFKSQNST